jgi:hypothetical protein
VGKEAACTAAEEVSGTDFAVEVAVAVDAKKEKGPAVEAEIGA